MMNLYQFVYNLKIKTWTFKWDNQIERLKARTWKQAKRRFFKKHGFYPGSFMHTITTQDHETPRLIDGRWTL